MILYLVFALPPDVSGLLLYFFTQFRLSQNIIHFYNICVRISLSCKVVFGEYCPIPLFAYFSIQCPTETRENFVHSKDTVRVYSSIRTVTQLCFVYYVYQQKEFKNVLNLRIGKYFPNTLYFFISRKNLFLTARMYPNHNFLRL